MTRHMRSFVIGAAIATAVMVLSGSGALCQDAAPETTVIMIGTRPIAGVILSHNEDGIKFRPADTNMPLELKWSHFAPMEAKRIQKSLGMGIAKAGMDDDEGKPSGDIIDAVRITLKKSRKTVLGIKDKDRSDGLNLYINTRNVKGFRISRADIAEVANVKVRESEVRSIGEMYSIKLAAITPTNAKDHYDLAEYCRAISHVEKASEHYERCKILDPRYAERIGDKTAELAIKAKKIQAKKLYMAITRDVGAEDFGDALKKIELFKSAFPDSDYLTKLLALVPTLEDKKKDSLRRKVITGWYLNLDGFLRLYVQGGVADGVETPMKIVRTKGGKSWRGILQEETPEVVVLRSEDGNIEYRLPRHEVVSITSVTVSKKKRDATFAEAKAYATDTEGGISASVAIKIAEVYGVTEEEAKAMWKNRLKKVYTLGSGGKVESTARYVSYREAGYGKGSWLREGAQSAVQITGGNTGGGGRGGRGGRGSRQQAAPSDASTDPEEWWKAQPRETRLTVLRAICYEAIMDVMDVKEIKCTRCGGKGMINRISSGSAGTGSVSICTRCHGVLVDYKITCR